MTDDEGGELTAGVRPAPAEEGRPQGKVQRHAGIGHENLQDVPMLQMVEQLPNVLRFFATRLPVVSEQVIAVPKISQDRTQQCLVDNLRQPQTTDQLVEVPTIVSYSSLHWNVEQYVRIPVPHRRGGLQDLRPGQDSIASCGADHVDNPVPCVGGLQGFLPRQASSASSSHSLGAADEAFTGFSHFSPNWKKCEVGCALGVGTGRGLEPIHAANLWRVHGGRGGRVGASDGVEVGG